tara:strand:- start:251 stop:1261 length:1011 start_codon:yes stop_codon:yes gene_type:complete
MSFKRFDSEDFIVSSDSITSTLWSTNSPTLTEFYTSSVQAAGSSGNFYLSVYQTASTETDSITQFDIAYADVKGSGSQYYNAAVVGKSPSLSTYGQYRALILEDENSSFIFGTENNVITAENFWVLSMERARYKESLFPGSLNLKLSGSNGIISLTDNSKDVLVNTFVGSSRVFQLVSGSNGSAYSSDGYVVNSGSYGLVFPELGTILLNPSAISQSIHVDALRTANSTNGVNNTTLYNSTVLGASFGLNSQETITSDYIFVRARNSEFNYTQNPTFISGSTGEVIYDNFINNPQTYITSIGLYNDSNELLSIAKLSRPLIKDFTKEALVRVKLDF